MCACVCGVCCVSVVCLVCACVCVCVCVCVVHMGVEEIWWSKLMYAMTKVVLAKHNTQLCFLLLYIAVYCCILLYIAVYCCEGSIVGKTALGTEEILPCTCVCAYGCGCGFITYVVSQF